MPTTYQSALAVAAATLVLACSDESTPVPPPGMTTTSTSGAGATSNTTGGAAPTTTATGTSGVGGGVASGGAMPDTTGAAPDAGGGTSVAPAAKTPPWDPAADELVWATEEFELAPGEEKYLCYAKTLEQDEKINSYWVEGAAFQHHLLFNRNRGQDPEGFEVCDVAFKSGWEPVFITGAGETLLELPEGAGHVIPAGTQMVVQMHLLNVKAEPVRSKLEIHMLRTAVENPEPVSTYILGDGNVVLPPQQETTLTGECEPGNVELIAAFPHMHLLGSKMVLEVSRGGGEFEEVFRREPFDFDDQHITDLPLLLQPGDRTRIHCTWNNPTDQTVTYGESTNEEMCYLVGFAMQDRMSACISNAVIPEGARP